MEEKLVWQSEEWDLDLIKRWPDLYYYLSVHSPSPTFVPHTNSEKGKFSRSPLLLQGFLCLFVFVELSCFRKSSDTGKTSIKYA